MAVAHDATLVGFAREPRGRDLLVTLSRGLEILEALASASPTRGLDRATLARRLGRRLLVDVRKEGCALDQGESYDGICAEAVPVFDFGVRHDGFGSLELRPELASFPGGTANYSDGVPLATMRVLSHRNAHTARRTGRLSELALASSTRAPVLVLCGELLRTEARHPQPS